MFNLQLLFLFPTTYESSLFKSLAPNPYLSTQDSILKTGWYDVADFPEDNYPFIHIDKATGQYDNYYVIPTPVISFKNIQSLELKNSPNPKLIMHFDSEGTAAWSKVTEQHIGGTLVFVCNNKLIQVFRVSEKVTSGIAEINRPVYDLDELKAFKLIIEKEKNQNHKSPATAIRVDGLTTCK